MFFFCFSEWRHPFVTVYNVMSTRSLQEVEPGTAWKGAAVRDRETCVKLFRLKPRTERLYSLHHLASYIERSVLPRFALPRTVPRPKHRFRCFSVKTENVCHILFFSSIFCPNSGQISFVMWSDDRWDWFSHHVHVSHKSTWHLSHWLSRFNPKNKGQTQNTKHTI